MSLISGENIKLDKNVKRKIAISGTVTFGYVGESSSVKSNTHTRATFEQPLSCRKNGWRLPSSHKFKQIHSLRAFQNGRYPLSETPSRTR